MTLPGDDAEHMTWEAEFVDGISAPARAAAESIDELGDESAETAAELRLLQREANKTGNSLAFLAAKNKLANTEIRDGVDYVKSIKQAYNEFTKKQEQHTRSTWKLIKSKKELRKAWNEAKKAGTGFMRFLGSLTKITFMAAKGVFFLSIAIGATGLVAAIVKAVPWLASLIVELSSLLSLAFLLPTAIGSLVASVATLKLAFKGIATAIGAGFSDDVEAYTEALNKLSPAAAKFVRNVVGYAPQLKSLQRTVQESFFAPLVDQVVPTLKALIPVIGDGAVKLAGSFSKVFSAIMQWARSPSGLSAVSSFFRTAQMFADTFAAHIAPVLEGFTRAIETVEPIWARLMNNMGSGMDKFGAWLTRISDDGTLERWLDTAFQVSKLLGNILGSVLRVVLAIAGASDGGALSSLSNLLNTLADFLESSEGQRQLMQFFLFFDQIIEALKPTLPIVGQILVLLAKAIADIVVGAAPGFIAFLQSLADMLANFTKDDPQFWVKFGEALGRVLQDLGTWLPKIGDVLKDVIEWLSKDDNLELVLGILAVIVLIINAVTFVAPLFAAASGIAAAFALAGWEVLVIIIAVIAIVVGLILIIHELATNWDTVTMYLGAAWQYFLDTYLKPFGALLWDLFVQPWINAYNFIAGIFRWIAEGWNTFTSLLDVAGATIQYALTHPFEAAYLAISNVFTRIIAKWNEVKDAVRAGWSGFLSAINPFDGRWMGGPVEGGMTYTVNELGPEKFLNSSGLHDIGDGSMGKWMAPSSGLVIPAHLTEALESISNGVAYQSGQEIDPSTLDGWAGRGGDTYIDQSEYHAHATVTNPQSDVDIERAVSRAMKKLKRDAEERR